MHYFISSAHVFAFPKYNQASVSATALAYVPPPVTANALALNNDNPVLGKYHVTPWMRFVFFLPSLISSIACPNLSRVSYKKTNDDRICQVVEVWKRLKQFNCEKPFAVAMDLR